MSFLFPLSAEDLLFAPTKSKQKIGAGTFGQQLVIVSFLKLSPSSYANLSHWLLKSPVSRGKWYGRFYANFFKTSKRFAIPLSTAYFIQTATMCHRNKLRIENWKWKIAEKMLCISLNLYICLNHNCLLSTKIVLRSTIFCYILNLVSFLSGLDTGNY